MCVFDSFNAAVTVLSLLRIGIDVASIAFSFAQFNSSSDFVFNGAIDGDLRYIGRFTLEAFNCHLKDYTTDVDTFNRWCVQGVSSFKSKLYRPWALMVPCRERHDGS